MTSGVSSNAKLRALLAVQLRLQNGESPTDAIAHLESNGVPPAEARETVHRIVETSRRENRGKGMLWLVLAIVCFAIATPFAVASVAGVEDGDVGKRGFATAILLAAALPALLVTAGGWLAYRGLRLVFGRGYIADPDA